MRILKLLPFLALLLCPTAPAISLNMKRPAEADFYQISFLGFLGPQAVTGQI